MGAGAPQLGAGAPQLGAATWQPLPAGLQHEVLQPPIRQPPWHFLQQGNKRSRRLGLQQALQGRWQPGSDPQVGPEGAAQVGAATPQVGAGAPQVGAGTPHEGAATWQPLPTGAQHLLVLQPLLQQEALQHFSLTHFTLQQLVEQQLVWQPQPHPPSITSSNSKPKLWLQVAKATTSVLRIMFHFIERRLLNDGTQPGSYHHRPTRGLGRPR